MSPDPFAAIAKPLSTPPPPGGADPFAAIAKPAAGGPPPPVGNGGGSGAGTPATGMQRVKTALTGENETDEQYQAPVTGGMLWGAVNSGAHLLGNVLDMISKPKEAAPSIGNPTGEGQPQQTKLAVNVDKHLQDAAAWLRSGGEPEGFWQNVGAIGEQVMEYVGTDGLLKLVGPAAGAVETAEHLKSAQQVAQTIKANPKIAGLIAVGLKAAKDATLMGAQTYGHTMDAGQAAEAAAMGGAGRVVTEGVGAAGRALLKTTPKTLTIAGEEIPALASQVNDAGEPTGTSSAGAPKIAQAQQTGAQGVLGNTARQGAGNALTWLNLFGNRTENAAAEGVPRLTAGEGAEPFTFHLEGPPTTETKTGEIAQSAKQEPRAAFKDPRFTAESAPTRTAEFVNGKPIPGAEGATGADIRTDRTPEARGEIVGGGGPLQTTDPREAEAWLQQLDDLKQSPAYDHLPIAQQSAIDKQYNALTDQLGLYHASPYVKRFSPADIPAAVSQINTFGDAAAQVQGAAKPIYETLDRVSDGQFSKFNGAVKQAQKVIRSATSMEAVESAQVKLSEANEAIENLMTRHASEISPTDYRAARSAWRDSMVLSNLHTVTERMMNGVTSEESAQGLPRIMTGKTKALENWLATGSNRASAERLIGADGVTNLKRITLLLSNQSSARAAASVAKEVFMTGMNHAGRMGSFGALAGGFLMHQAGGEWASGAIGGAALEAGTRYVLRQAATNPAVGKLLEFAARNHLSPEHYAPLIARALTTPLQSQEGEQEPAAEPAAEQEAPAQ